MKEKIRLIEEIASKNQGIIKHADLASLRIEYRSIQRFLQDNFLEKVINGTYRVTGCSIGLSPAEEVRQLFPDGVTCMFTALYKYGYIDIQDLNPDIWDLAFSKDVSKTRFNIGKPAVKPYFYEPKHLEYGFTGR